MLTCNKKNTAWILALTLLLSLTFSGCQNIESAYLGYKAKDESIIKLAPQGNQQGSWKTFDVSLNYQYGYADNLLQVSGTINLNPYYDLNFSLIRTLDVYLFFLDDESRVLATEVLVRALPQRPDQALEFAEEIAVPAGCRAIVFGYSGEATGERGSPPGRGGLGFFSDMPKRPR